MHACMCVSTCNINSNGKRAAAAARLEENRKGFQVCKRKKSRSAQWYRMLRNLKQHIGINYIAVSNPNRPF